MNFKFGYLALVLLMGIVATNGYRFHQDYDTVFINSKDFRDIDGKCKLLEFSRESLKFGREWKIRRNLISRCKLEAAYYFKGWQMVRADFLFWKKRRFDVDISVSGERSDISFRERFSKHVNNAQLALEKGMFDGIKPESKMQFQKLYNNGKEEKRNLLLRVSEDEANEILTLMLRAFIKGSDAATIFYFENSSKP